MLDLPCCCKRVLSLRGVLYNGVQNSAITVDLYERYAREICKLLIWSNKIKFESHQPPQTALVRTRNVMAGTWALRT